MQFPERRSGNKEQNVMRNVHFSLGEGAKKERNREIIRGKKNTTKAIGLFCATEVDSLGGNCREKRVLRMSVTVVLDKWPWLLAMFYDSVPPKVMALERIMKVWFPDFKFRRPVIYKNIWEN